MVGTHRAGGRVRHSHVAGLGSIGISPSPADRNAFWTKLHQRLAALANRIGAKAHGAILAAVHARIPMPTPDDQRMVLIENVRADARLWDALADMQAGDIEGHKALAASLLRTIPDREAAAADAAGKARAAAERLARAERGEDVGGIGKRMTRKALIAAIGWRPADIRHALRPVEIEERGAHADLMDEIMKRHRQAEKTALRAVLARRQS